LHVEIKVLGYFDPGLLDLGLPFTPHFTSVIQSERRHQGYHSRAKNRIAFYLLQHRTRDLLKRLELLFLSIQRLKNF
jgi:hypothetical protein